MVARTFHEDAAGVAAVSHADAAATLSIAAAGEAT